MSFLFRQSPSPEEVEKVRKERTNYQDFLSRTSTNTIADVKNQTLTPEGGQSILKEIQSAQTWLQGHPNANLNELLTNRDATEVEIKRLLQTDKPKYSVFVFEKALPVLAKSYQQTKRITPEQATKLNSLASETQSWLKKSSASATLIDYDTQKLKITDQLKQIVPTPDVFQSIQTEIEKLSTENQSSLQTILQSEENRLTLAKSYEVDVQDGLSTGVSVAVKTFIIGSLVIVCLWAGSLAANFAIARPPMYRVLYFIYGAIPIFSPFVLVYSLYQRLMNGPLSNYSILPLSIEPSTGGKVAQALWWPFYWIPDGKAVASVSEFQKNLNEVSV
jgi:hypothetical protein